MTKSIEEQAQDLHQLGITIGELMAYVINHDCDIETSIKELHAQRLVTPKHAK